MKIKVTETQEVYVEFKFSSLDGDDMTEEAIYDTIDAETACLEEAGYRLDYDSEVWQKENGIDTLFVEHVWLKTKVNDDTKTEDTN